MTKSTGVGRGNHGKAGRKKTGLTTVHHDVTLTGAKTRLFRRVLQLTYDRPVTDEDVKILLRVRCNRMVEEMRIEFTQKLIASLDKN